MASVRDRLAAARTAAREDDRNGVKRQPGASIGQNESAGASPRPTAVNETAQSGNDAVDVRDRLASAKEQARKADSTVRTRAEESPSPTGSSLNNEQDDAGSVSFWKRIWNTAGGVLGDYAEEFLPESGSDFARRMGYNAERAVAAVLGTGESLTDLAGTALYTGVEKAASLGGLAPNAVSEWAGKAADKFLDNSITERYEQSIKERYNPSVGEEKWGNLTAAGANMATAIAAGSAAASAVGKASSGAASLLGKADDAARAAKYSKAAFGIQAAGGATNEAHDEGATREQALTYGAAVGAMETAIESIAGGIPGLGKGKIGEIARKVVGSPAVSRILDTLGEGGEEALSAFLTPFIKRAIYNKDAASATAGEIAESVITGILLSGIAQVGASIAGRAAGTAQEATQESAGARIAQQETVDTEQQKAAAEATTSGNGQGAQTTTGDTLLDAIIKTMQPVTNRQAEALLNDPASAAQLGIDTNGMTKAQQRSAVKERAAQMQREVPYDRGTDPLLQAIVGGISTGQNVENRNGFDSQSVTGYTENTENAALGGEQNGTQLDGAAGEGVRAEGAGAVGGREYAEGQGPIGQGDLSNPGVVLVSSLADKYGVVLDNGGKGRNKSGKRSQQAQSVIDRAAIGEEISLDELNAIPEIAMALEEELNGVETRSLSNRDGIVQDGIKRALERGSYSGKNSDGKDTFNGAVRRGNRIDIVTGVAGSGKSSVYSNRISQDQGSRIIDTDDYRDFIPEYNGRNASLVHDEASAIKDAILERSIELGENIILSTVGDDAAKLARNIQRYHALGYEVHLHLNHLQNEKAIGRVVARYVNSNGEIGRLVKPELVKNMGDKPMKAYLEITGQGGSAYADTRAGKKSGAENEGDRGAGRGAHGSDAGSAYREAQTALASWDAYDNDVPFGQPARFLSDISNPEVKKSQPSGTVGAAAAGFETPGSQSVERTSRLAETALPYTMRRGEATARTRQEYDEMFRYRSQTEQQSLQAANDMLYYQVDGQPVFLMDLDPESYRAITDSLRLAPAWNAVMGDAAMLIERELMGRSIDGTVSEDVYTEWLTTIREHGTAGGQGVQAMAKWSREDNRNGQRTRADALHNLENSNLSEEERTQRFQAIVKFDRSIEAAQTDADLRQIILDIARQRGTLSGLTGKQSKILEWIANASLDGMTFEQLKQFAYSSSAALSMDASPANAGAKMKTLQILNMLSSPKTAAKNISGNTSFYGLDAMAMRGAALLDMALSKITGTRSVAMESSIFGDRQARADMAKAIRMSLAEITMDVDMVEENNRYQYGGNRTFKAAGTGAFGTNTAADRFLERVLSACERNMGYLMTTTDEAYKGMARSTQRGTQALVDHGKIKNAGKDYAKNQADSLAKYRTFQNGGRVATAIQTVHDVLNLVGIGDSGKRLGSGSDAKTVHSFGLGDLVAPFTRVAGNLASVGVDYSPVNAVKGTVEIMDAIRNAAMGGDADPGKQAKAVSDFARGMSGTAIAYGVMLLAQAGIIKRAEDEDDKDVASLNRSEGMVGTQVNVDAAKRMLDGGDGTWQTGDTLIDMSNLEPINFIFSLGVELADNETGGFLSTFGDVNTYKDAYTAIKNAAGDLPVLSGVGDFAKDVLVYNNDPLESGAEMLGKTAISSLTPNSMAALAKGMDDKQRSVYSGDALTSVLWDTFKSRIPGLRETLPTTVNTLGQEVENPGNQAQRIINAMFNPLGVNQYNQSDVSQEMERVRKATGETGFYPTTRKPSALSYTDKDGKEHEVELDYEQKQRFQAVCGATQMNLMADMIGSSGYKSSGAARQADLLNDVYSYSYQYAKAGVLGEDSVYKWVKNTMSAQKSVGLSPTTVILYRDTLSREEQKSSASEAKSTVRRQIFQDSGLNAAQKGALDDIVISDGIYIPKEVNVDYSSYDSFIISQMSEGAQKRYGSISAKFGLDAETYQKAWNIYQDDDLKADEKRAKLYGMGLNGQAIYKEFGKKIS